MSEGDDALVISYAGEVWLPMSRARARRRGTVPCDTAAYEISSRGRLRNPHGVVTQGFLFDGKRWAAVPGSGLVNLHAAAKVRPASRTLPPRLAAARDCLGAGHTPSELAQVLGTLEGTAWSYT